eukprot:CAMPEP_0113548878 /NCGR_PEP_ID=MMETSP0015_2-20120614/13129_1 /TAXON_ID=2838 /ORGANISM="Odontella" /LENGTH=94 /DNA_ID=CAMNT_0000449539 /DNA_START=237 /DNA_END=517 /DNA_ORIENTATION=+ /assembly_acc=CAM_ASM_000160
MTLSPVQVRAKSPVQLSGVLPPVQSPVRGMERGTHRFERARCHGARTRTRTRRDARTPAGTSDLNLTGVSGSRITAVPSRRSRPGSPRREGTAP